ncbi:chemotaxis protein CheW [[Brevibacterium] frigoritolerans]|nr:chemotaxis protein CheW [Peribacillus frigoritolerans]
MKILTFYINEKKYGISIENVVTIEKNDRKVTDIPKTQKSIRGVVNIRSKICPVIDLRMMLENTGNTLDETKKLILFEIDEKNGALLVDDTDNIMDVEESNIEEFESGDVKTNVINQDGDVFVLINIEDFAQILEQ